MKRLSGLWMLAGTPLVCKAFVAYDINTCK
jgi:hypothetical protein